MPSALPEERPFTLDHPHTARPATTGERSHALLLIGIERSSRGGLIAAWSQRAGARGRCLMCVPGVSSRSECQSSFQAGEAEGDVNRKAITARRGLKAVEDERTGRHTGIG
jgi:hypothetical protein